MKKFLVTGGLGFIGSNFIRHLLKASDASVINLDKQTYAGNRKNLEDIEKDSRYRWVHGDIVDNALVQDLAANADAIVHFAAETHVDRSILEPDAFVKTNVLGTQTLLQAALEKQVKLFLHVSTDEVYGSVSTGESREDDALWPNSPYSASKAAADLLVRSYQKTYGLPAIITRCSNNFGPYQFPEKALPLLITNAMENQPFPLYGDGSHVRDWLYVLDHVKAISFLIEKGIPGECYNICGSKSLSNLELVTTVLSLMDKPENLIRRVTDRPGHDHRYALNGDKLRALGWHAATPFEDALEETIRWYHDHTDWWNFLKGNVAFKKYYQKQYSHLMEMEK